MQFDHRQRPWLSDFNRVWRLEVAHLGNAGRSLLRRLEVALRGLRRASLSRDGAWSMQFDHRQRPWLSDFNRVW